jgi:hypothetical protein
LSEDEGGVKLKRALAAEMTLAWSSLSSLAITILSHVGILINVDDDVDDDGGGGDVR